MDNLGIIPPPPVVINIIKPAISVPSSAPVAQKPEASFVSIGGDTGNSFDQKLAEQQRLQTVQRLSQKVADVYVVSDRTFSIFKDTSGQYVTRFTSLRDGRVTYVPEPNLVKLGGESDTLSVDIKV